MAIGLIFEGPGVTQAQYEQVLNEVTAGGNSIPEGRSTMLPGRRRMAGW
jgi:hypothetical protein